MLSVSSENKIFVSFVARRLIHNTNKQRLTKRSSTVKRTLFGQCLSTEDVAEKPLNFGQLCLSIRKETSGAGGGDKKLEANFGQCSSIGDVGKKPLKLKANFGQCLVDRTRDFGKKKKET